MEVTIKNGRQSTIMEEVEEIVSAELYGGECFDENGFYQFADIDGVTYKIYYSTTDENGDEIALDCIDYSKALNIVEADDSEEDEETIKDVESSASALYDGGWRAEDREDLIAEYQLTDEDADKLCRELLRLENINE